MRKFRIIIISSGILLLGLKPSLVISLIPFPNPFNEKQTTTNPTQCDSSIICPGEELTYEVSWWVFKLGQIRLKILDPTFDDKQIHHNAVAYIDSYDDVPFVDIHAIDHTEMNNEFYSLGFRFFEKKKDRWLSEKSSYDKQSKRLIIEKGWQAEVKSPIEGPLTYDTLSVKENPFHDGLSILFFARANIHRNHTVQVPTIVYGKIGRTIFEHRNTKTTLDVDAFDHPVRVVELEGRAEFEGLLGMTGDFKGWFSDDIAAIPIKAELQVVLGSVTLELKSWKRIDWKPPLNEN
jgi:hypothetical protein